VRALEEPPAAPPAQPGPLKESMLPTEDEYDIPAFMRKRL
jgi:hypothetical protein